MSIFARLLLALGLIVALSLPGLSAQEASNTELPANLEFKKHYTPEEIPNFLVVSSFFRRADILLNHDHAAVTRSFLEELEIPLELQPFFAEVTDEAIRILSEPLVDPELEGEEFMNHQYRVIERKATSLGALFATFLSGLEEAAATTDGVKRYCEEQIRATLSVASTEETNGRYLESTQAFDRAFDFEREGKKP